MFLRITILSVFLVNTYNQGAIKNKDLGSYKWSLVKMQEESLSASPVFLQFDTAGHRFSGNAGCNKIGGNYTINDSLLTFMQVISTRMACVDEKAHERESRLLRLLNDHAYSYKINKTTLQLIDSGKVTLQFQGS